MLASAGLTAAIPASASAYATPEAPPIFSAAPGLPDGRVYEQVSPADKNGNEAGAGTDRYLVGAEVHYGFAAAGGNSVLFEGTGPMGESPAGYSQYFVASKNQGAAGWSTRALMPRYQESVAEIKGTLFSRPSNVDPSPDLSHAMVAVYHALASGCVTDLYITDSDPFLPATPLCATGSPVGGTPDFSTVYFVSADNLLGAPWPAGAAGFYEDSEGVVRQAGALPDGALDPFGAVPAASGHGRALAGNQVSADGSRAFFVSPDPGSCTGTGLGENNCALDPPELYLHELGRERAILVSRDTLLPEVEGLPAAVPGGVSQMLNPTDQSTVAPRERTSYGSYVFASPDGSQAFFQSTEDLTEPAEEASPGSEPKTYDFDVDTGSLTYLPDVVGQIVATDTDGSSLAFVRPAAGALPAELDLWSAGPAGGSVTPITQLPGTESGPEHEPLHVQEARMSNDGSAVVFLTSSTLPGAFNSGGGEQLYRYDVPANTLGCVSCPPHGVTPNGNTTMSQMQRDEIIGRGVFEAEYRGAVNDRGISADGDRIFFDTPAPLVPQDTNTNSPEVPVSEGESEKQGRDVYEWENGVVYLISSGKSPRDSYFLDNSENGNDVFFATTEGLVPGDTDGGYDVYDARVPYPGDTPPAAAVPCEGAVCQGPPNVPSPLTPPASATFSGLGNPPSEETTLPPAKKVTTKTVKCKKGFAKKKNKCVKQKSSKKAKKSDHRSGK
jgi:hypothetical protein